MNIVEQIKQICEETENEWFLTHGFPQMALFDLELKEIYEKENDYLMFDEKECVCFQNKYCISCEIDIERSDYFNNVLKLPKWYTYNFKTEENIKSKWIIPEMIDGKIPGFVLIKCDGFEEFTHELVFAIVKNKYRKQGILKEMLSKIPKEWKIWLEAKSNDIENVENIWEKCGFVYHKTIDEKHLIFQKGKNN